MALSRWQDYAAEPGDGQIWSIKFHCGRAVLISQAAWGWEGGVGRGGSFDAGLCTVEMRSLGRLKPQGPWLQSHQPTHELEQVI